MCVCVCVTEGCPVTCGGHGSCQLIASSEWMCQCDEGYTGVSCSTAVELICDDFTDDDTGVTV